MHINICACYGNYYTVSAIELDIFMITQCLLHSCNSALGSSTDQPPTVMSSISAFTIYNPLSLLSRMTTIGMPPYMSGCREGCAYGQANRPNPVVMEESNA